MAEVPHDYISSNRNSSNSDAQKVWASNAHLGHGGGPHSDQPLSENKSLPLSSKLMKDDYIDVKLIRLDISFKSPSHTGLQTSELVFLYLQHLLVTQIMQSYVGFVSYKIA